MNETLLQENLQKVLEDFALDLQYLMSQQVLTSLDVQKIKAQAEVSKNAMLSAKEDRGFNDQAKEKLLNALIQNFELTIQKSLSDAITRKGEKALIIYKLRRVDRKIHAKAIERRMSTNDLAKLQVSMQILRAYVLMSLPEKIGRWGGTQTDTVQIVKNYERVLIEYMDGNLKPIQLQG